MNTQNVSNTEVNQFVPTSPEGLDGQPVQCENFSQFANLLPELQESAVYAKCEELFQHLEGERRDAERSRRGELIATSQSYRQSHYLFGKVLHDYWFWSERPKGKRTKPSQSETFEQLCTVLKVEKRTGYNILKGYETACTVQLTIREVATELGIDLATKKNSELVKSLQKSHNVQEDNNPKQSAKEVILKAQHNIEAEKAQKKAEKVEPSHRDNLIAFLYKEYGGKVSVSEFKTDLAAARKMLSYYKRDDGMVPTKAQNPKSDPAIN